MIGQFIIVQYYHLQVISITYLHYSRTLETTSQKYVAAHDNNDDDDVNFREAIWKYLETACWH